MNSRRSGTCERIHDSRARIKVSRAFRYLRTRKSRLDVKGVRRYDTINTNCGGFGRGFGSKPTRVSLRATFTFKFDFDLVQAKEISWEDGLETAFLVTST